MLWGPGQLLGLITREVTHAEGFPAREHTRNKSIADILDSYWAGGKPADNSVPPALRYDAYGVGPILAHPLGRIMDWCARERLPALTAIVVEKETGLPSTGLTTVPQGDFAAEQQRVFAFDWYSIFPPTLNDLGPP